MMLPFLRGEFVVIEIDSDAYVNFNKIVRIYKLSRLLLFFHWWTVHGENTANSLNWESKVLLFALWVDLAVSETFRQLQKELMYLVTGLSVGEYRLSW